MSDDGSLSDIVSTGNYNSSAGKGDNYRPVRKSRYDQNFDKINWSQWYVYILECNDKTLYCGITNDLDKRINAHNDGKGAKYTSGRTPVVLKWNEKCGTKSDALKREIEIKKMKKAEKLWLISGSKDKVDSNTVRTTDL